MTVTTTADVVNGNVSSPAALIADPGPDGISLREAILAANNAPGPHSITFSPDLAGQTIAPTSPLRITQNGIAMEGLTTPDGQPAITLNAEGTSPWLLFVRASDFTLTGFRITGFPVKAFGVSIRAGAFFQEPGPSRLSNIRIEGNVFTNEGFPASGSLAISLGMESMAANAVVSDVSIAGNVFVGFQGDANAIHVAAGGTDDRIENVVVYNNSFASITFPVELVGANGVNSTIVGARIVGNTFTTSLQPVNLNHIGSDGSPATSGNVIEDTLIARNKFFGNRGPSIVFLGGMTNATGNAITNTRIVNNLIVGGTTYDGVGLVGGRQGGTQNRIAGVQIVNNTITQNAGGGITSNPNLDGAFGNTITGVSVLNTIVSGNGSTDFYGLTPDQVRFSLTGSPQFAGMNGNIIADPKFVNPSQGDYHLQTGSPAIDAGSSDGAPLRDLECRSRVDDPGTPNKGGGALPFYDIGAFEYGGGPPDCTVQLTVTKTGTGSGTVTSAPTGIDCGGTCSAGFPQETAVTLTATAATGSTFTGWSGDCAGTSTTCTVSMAQARTVTATFVLLPSVAFTAASSSGSEAVTPAALTVALSAPSGQPVTVNYAVTGGTATGGGVDYTLPSGTLTFAPGETTKAIPIAIVNDALDEPDETIQVTLASPVNATLGTPAVHTYTILDDDPTPGLSINDVTMTEGHSGTTNATFTVTLSAGSGRVVTVAYATADGTATAPADYTAVSGTLTFAPGETSKTITVLVKGDTLDEPNETFLVKLSNPTNATLARAQGVGTITDDDETLTVTKTGTGSGAVTSNPTGITCGADCTESYAYDTLVTLTATPSPGSLFTRWEGDCTGTSPTCTVRMTQARSVTVVFTRDLEGIEARLTCPATITPGAPLTLSLTLRNRSLLVSQPVAKSALAVHLADLRALGPFTIPLARTLAPGETVTISPYFSVPFPSAPRGTFSSLGVLVLDSANQVLGRSGCLIEVR